MTKNHNDEGQHDRVSDIAGIGWSGRDRGVGGIFVSASIIRFIPRPDREPADFPAITFRSAIRPDDLTMDHVDTGARDVVWPEFDET